MRKKILSLLLVSAMSILTVACAGNSQSKTTAQPEATTVLATSQMPSVSAGQSVESSVQTTEASKAVTQYSRIIAASKTIAEYLELFDAPVVGIAEQKALPKVYAELPKVGSPRKLNLELIVSLKPDLVVANSSSEKEIEESMKNQGIKTLYVDSNSYDKVFENIRMFGELFARSDKAQQLIDAMKSKEAGIVEKVAALKGKKAVLLFGTGDKFQLATKNSYLGSLLEKIGMENIAGAISAEAGTYVPFSLEQVIAQNPDYILTLAHGNKEQAEKAFEEELKKALWSETAAAKAGRIIHLDDSLYPVTGNVEVMETLEGLTALLLEAGTK